MDIIKKINRKVFAFKYRDHLEMNEGSLFPTRNLKVRFGKNSKIRLRNALFFDENSIAKKGSISLLRLDDDAIIDTKGNFKFMYGADIILFKRAILVLGKNSFINSDCKIRCHKSITIGDDCAISHDFTVMDSDAHYLDGDNHTNPVVIGNNVWIGTRVTVLNGVRIGDGAVIASGAVVTKNIPDRCLAAGVPAKVIRENVEWSR